MYEELTQMENDIMKVLDKYRQGQNIPVAVIVAVLDNVKFVTQHDVAHPTETLPVTAIPDDAGPAMTVVEKNLESS